MWPGMAGNNSSTLLPVAAVSTSTSRAGPGVSSALSLPATLYSLRLLGWVPSMCIQGLPPRFPAVS